MTFISTIQHSEFIMKFWVTNKKIKYLKGKTPLNIFIAVRSLNLRSYISKSVGLQLFKDNILSYNLNYTFFSLKIQFTFSMNSCLVNLTFAMFWILVESYLCFLGCKRRLFPYVCNWHIDEIMMRVKGKLFNDILLSAY